MFESFDDNWVLAWGNSKPNPKQMFPISRDS